MHRKIVVIVASIMFAVLSVMAFVFGDLLDRSYPVELGARALVTMDFATADIRDDAALEDLAELSDRFGMGVVRVLPELGGDKSGEVFVVVGRSGPRRGQILRFGDQPPSRVVSRDALAFSFSDGTYLLTGSDKGDGALRAWLGTHRVASRWEGNGAAQVFKLAIQQPPFVIAFSAALSLMASLILFWVATKARGRSLRVLAGVPSYRIQYEDIGTFLFLVLLAAAPVLAGASVVVTATRGMAFTWYYASLLGAFELTLITVAALGAVITMASSWPNERALATRTPPLGSLRKVAKTIMATTFLLVLVAIGPTLQAQAESAGVAAQQAKWNALADQVLLNFPAGLGENGFERIRDKVRDVIADGEEQNAVAMSYAVPEEGLGMTPAAMAGYDHVALVNSHWLTLMASGAEPSRAGANGKADGVAPLTVDQVPKAVKEWLDANLRLWVPRRDERAVKAWWGAAKMFSYSKESGVPFALAGSGDLAFPDKALVLVVDDLRNHFDADFLASLATSRNLTFTGLQRTLGLLVQHGLRSDLQVRYVAEAGILRAQFAAYSAWLDTASVGALAVAFVMATMVGTLITGLLLARHDFPLRLAGSSWPEILATRLLKEWSVGFALVLAALAFRRDYDPVPVITLALGGLVISATMHLQVSKWAFKNVSLRRL